jgi:hypothetical protein
MCLNQISCLKARKLEEKKIKFIVSDLKKQIFRFNKSLSLWSALLIKSNRIKIKVIIDKYFKLSP